MQKNHLVPKNCVMRSAPRISVLPNDKIGAQRSGSDFDDGPSGAIRTRGFQLPKLAPYRLGYTRKYEVLRLRCYYTTLAVVVKHVVMGRFSEKCREGETSATPVK